MYLNRLPHLPPCHEVDNLITSPQKGPIFREEFVWLIIHHGGFKKHRGVLGKTFRRFNPNAEMFSFGVKMLILTV